MQTDEERAENVDDASAGAAHGKKRSRDDSVADEKAEVDKLRAALAGAIEMGKRDVSARLSRRRFGPPSARQAAQLSIIGVQPKRQETVLASEGGMEKEFDEEYLALKLALDPACPIKSFKHYQSAECRGINLMSPNDALNVVTGAHRRAPRAAPPRTMSQKPRIRPRAHSQTRARIPEPRIERRARAFQNRALNGAQPRALSFPAFASRS
jgi:hypothetical protein